MQTWYLDDAMFIRERRPELKKDVIIAQVFPAARTHNYDKLVNCRIMFNQLLAAYRMVELELKNGDEDIFLTPGQVQDLSDSLRRGLLAGGYNDEMFERWLSVYD